MNNIYVDSEQLLNCALNLKKNATNILTTFQNECSHAITAGNECLRVSGLDSSAVNTSLNKIFTNTYDQLMLLANFLATNVAQEYDLTTQAIAKSFNQEFANEIASLLGITVGTITGGATGIGTNISGSSGIAGGYSGGSGYFGGTCGSSPSTGSPNASPYPNGNQTGQVNLTNLTPEEKAKLEAAGYKWQCGPDGCGWYKTDPNTGQPILADSSDLNKMYGILGADQNGKYKPMPSTSTNGGTKDVPSKKSDRPYISSRDSAINANSMKQEQMASRSINTSVSSTKSSYTNEKMDILGKTDNSPSFSSKSSYTNEKMDILGKTDNSPSFSSKSSYTNEKMDILGKTDNSPSFSSKSSSSKSGVTTRHEKIITPSGKTITQTKSTPNPRSTPGYVRDAKPSNTRTKVYDSSTKSNSKWA